MPLLADRQDWGCLGRLGSLHTGMVRIALSWYHHLCQHASQTLYPCKFLVVSLALQLYKGTFYYTAPQLSSHPGAKEEILKSYFYPSLWQLTPQIGIPQECHTMRRKSPWCQPGVGPVS